MMTIRDIGLAATKALDEGRVHDAEMWMEFALASKPSPTLDADIINRLRIRISAERHIRDFWALRGDE